MEDAQVREPEAVPKGVSKWMVAFFVLLGAFFLSTLLQGTFF